MSLYLSGPMTGVPKNNFPAFQAAAMKLRAQGWLVMSPAESGLMGTREDYMRHDIALILQCDAIVVLPGWENSEGCLVELAVAAAIGVPAYLLEEFLQDRHAALPLGSERQAIAVVEESVCQEADRLVSVDRQADYGHPYWDFQKTAAMWSTIFGVAIEPEQVGLAMICVKISRELNKHKHDNLVDICGYAKTIELVNEKRQELADASV